MMQKVVLTVKIKRIEVAEVVGVHSMAKSLRGALHMVPIVALPDAAINLSELL